MALNVADEYLELVKKNLIPPNSKWKVKETGYDSLFELKHSNIPIEYFLIDVIRSNSISHNINTHITNDDIHSDLNTKTLNPTKNNAPISEEDPNTFKIGNHMDKKFNGNKLKKKKEKYNSLDFY